MNGHHNAARPPHYDFFPPEVLDPRVLETWAPVAEARITRVGSGRQLLASRSQKAREDRQNPSMKEYPCLFE